MNRRQFFLLKERIAELSGEQLYMRYVDSTRDGTTAELFQNLEQCLTNVNSLRLTEAAWLSCDELKPAQTILAAFRARGGRIEERQQPPTPEA